MRKNDVNELYVMWIGLLRHSSLVPVAGNNILGKYFVWGYISKLSIYRCVYANDWAIKISNDWCFRPRFCIARLYWAGDLYEWDEFCCESCPWRRIDRSTYWPSVQRSTVPRLPPINKISSIIKFNAWYNIITSEFIFNRLQWMIFIMFTKLLSTDFLKIP